MYSQKPPLDQALIIRLRLPPETVDGLSHVGNLVAQIPEPSNVPTGMVAVSDEVEGEPQPSWFQRVTGRGSSRRVHRAARCTALLARGFVRIGAERAEDGLDWAWGYAELERR